jgi:hypothetical protein
MTDQIVQTLTALRTERQILTAAIENLEQLERCRAGQPASPAQSYNGKRRGRKSMGSEERQEVSARMKRYWSGRRQAKAHRARQEKL